MDERLFELIEKMYSEMQQGFKRVNEKFIGIDEKLNKLDKGQTALEDRLENTRKTLFDGYKQNAEGIQRIESKLDELTAKVVKQEVEIRVIKGAK